MKRNKDKDTGHTLFIKNMEGIPNLNQCPKCGRFVRDIRYIENGLHEIKDIFGDCKAHGEVSLMSNDWGYEDIHTESEEECEENRKKVLSSMPAYQ